VVRRHREDKILAKWTSDSNRTPDKGKLIRKCKTSRSKKKEHEIKFTLFFHQLLSSSCLLQVIVDEPKDVTTFGAVCSCHSTVVMAIQTIRKHCVKPSDAIQSPISVLLFYIHE
jgi:hypothetical protein